MAIDDIGALIFDSLVAAYWQLSNSEVYLKAIGLKFKDKQVRSEDGIENRRLSFTSSMYFGVVSTKIATLLKSQRRTLDM